MFDGWIETYYYTELPSGRPVVGNYSSAACFSGRVEALGEDGRLF